jgi:Sec-independent protein translocase protein TatA
MAKKQTRNQDGLATDNVDGNVDKIREILFGGQMRDYEQRFADLETRLTKQIESIANGFEKRIDRLDTFAKREIEKLVEQVKEERKARREDGKLGSKELKGLAQQLESWCGELEEQIGSETQELRGQLQEQSEELSGMVSDAHDQLSKSLAEETKNLADGKLAREDLAAILAELSSRLKKDSRSSGA